MLEIRSNDQGNVQFRGGNVSLVDSGDDVRINTMGSKTTNVERASLRLILLLHLIDTLTDGVNVFLGRSDRLASVLNLGLQHLETTLQAADFIILEILVSLHLLLLGIELCVQIVLEMRGQCWKPTMRLLRRLISAIRTRLSFF